GVKPRPVRTTSGSRNSSRARRSELLTADWVTCRRAAARVALRSSSKARTTCSRLRSISDRFMALITDISTYDVHEEVEPARLRGKGVPVTPADTTRSTGLLPRVSRCAHLA